MDGICPLPRSAQCVGANDRNHHTWPQVIFPAAVRVIIPPAHFLKSNWEPPPMHRVHCQYTTPSCSPGQKLVCLQDTCTASLHLSPPGSSARFLFSLVIGDYYFRCVSQGGWRTVPGQRRQPFLGGKAPGTSTHPMIGNGKAGLKGVL